MKRLIILLLVFVYAIPAVGLSFTMHYCGGEIASVSLGFSNKKSCGCSVESEKKGCCDERTFTIKSDEQQQKTEQLNGPVFHVEWYLSFERASFDYSFLNKINCPVAFNTNRPPPLPKTPLFILYNVFRI